MTTATTTILATDLARLRRIERASVALLEWLDGEGRMLPLPTTAWPLTRELYMAVNGWPRTPDEDDARSDR